MLTKTILSTLLATLAVATPSPDYDGFNKVWEETFGGGQNELPSQDNWNIIQGNLGVNAELETYTNDPNNIHQSGSGTLQIVPLRNGDQWTSGRIESKNTFTPDDGKLTRVEASLRFGAGATENKQGIWPAWWMLGDSIRNGVVWPQCGELDIMETVNGEFTGHGTMHCDVFPGGACNEGNGLGNPVDFQGNDYHTWRIELDRHNPDWTQQAITWYLDDTQFWQITGSTVGKEDVWTNVCHSPLFFILNVAVGGSWVSPLEHKPIQK